MCCTQYASKFGKLSSGHRTGKGQFSFQSQRTAIPKNNRHKKPFFGDQCKEIEEKSRIGKTRDLYKKIRDIKGIFHAKMGSIKDRNGMDLTEAEDIKKRWQEYTEDFTKEIFITQITMMV